MNRAHLYNEERLTAEIAALVLNHIPNRDMNQSGMWLDFEWLANICDEDPDLARTVLIRSGFRPAPNGRWLWARGNRSFAAVGGDKSAFSNSVTDLLDLHRPV